MASWRQISVAQRKGKQSKGKKGKSKKSKGKKGKGKKSKRKKGKGTKGDKPRLCAVESPSWWWGPRRHPRHQDRKRRFPRHQDRNIAYRRIHTPSLHAVGCIFCFVN